MIKKWPLGEQGYHYIRRELQHGSTLAKLIGESQLSEGVCETVIPEEINIHSIVDLSASVYLITGVSLQANRSYINGIINKYLRDADVNCMIVETFLQPTDFLLIKRSEPFFIYEDEVYYYVKKGISNEIIKSAILDARAYPKIIILSSYDKVIRKGDVIKEEDLQLISKNVSSVGLFL